MAKQRHYCLGSDVCGCMSNCLLLIYETTIEAGRNIAEEQQALAST